MQDCGISVSSAEGKSHQPIQKSVALFRGHQFSSPVRILFKKFFSASAIGIMSWQDVIQSSLRSGVKGCGTKPAHIVLLPKSSFRIRRTTVLGMFKNSAIILNATRQSFFTKSATAAMFTQFDSILDSHHSRHLLPTTFRLKIENTTYKHLIGSEPHSHKPFAPILVFLSQIDRL
jgi:hypothetical protein